jgi:hypothetical protein
MSFSRRIKLWWHLKFSDDIHCTIVYWFKLVMTYTWIIFLLVVFEAGNMIFEQTRCFGFKWLGKKFMNEQHEREMSLSKGFNAVLNLKIRRCSKKWFMAMQTSLARKYNQITCQDLNSRSLSSCSYQVPDHRANLARSRLKISLMLPKILIQSKIRLYGQICLSLSYLELFFPNCWFDHVTSSMITLESAVSDS